jgi:hypothetical protein
VKRPVRIETKVVGEVDKKLNNAPYELIVTRWRR